MHFRFIGELKSFNWAGVVLVAPDVRKRGEFSMQCAFGSNFPLIRNPSPHPPRMSVVPASSTHCSSGASKFWRCGRSDFAITRGLVLGFGF